MYPLEIIEALWFILPAYIANSTPLHITRVSSLRKYNKPIDGGRTFNGFRIFGDNKTWRGLISGICGGVFVGGVQILVQDNSPFYVPRMTFTLAFVLSVGALAGDLAGSFVKRRNRLEPGSPAPLLDQLNFVFGALLLAWLMKIKIPVDYVVILLIITPVLHLLTNFIAWAWRWKKHPW